MTKLSDFVSPRILELSKSKFIREGAIDFDNAYAVAVMDASIRVGLAEQIIKNPGEITYFVNMGWYPDDNGGGTIWTQTYD